MSAPVPALAPLTEAMILARASTALGRVDRYGRRGVTLLSMDEIEALALFAASCGLVPTMPGEDAPKAYFLAPEGAVK